MKLLPPKKSIKDLIEFTRWGKLERELDKLRNAGVSAAKVRAVLREIRTEHETVCGIAKRRGRAKGGGQSSKQKGRAVVILVRDLLLRTYDLKPDDILVKATSMGGCDIHLSPHAQTYFPFAIEAKGVEALSVWAALAQAEVNAKKKNSPPVLFFKRAHSPLYIAFKADDLLHWAESIH
jgi:hypothetical protein